MNSWPLFGNLSPKEWYLVKKIEIIADSNKMAFEGTLSHYRTTQNVLKYNQGVWKNFFLTMKFNERQADTNKCKTNLFAKFFSSVYIESSIFHPVEEVITCR